MAESNAHKMVLGLLEDKLQNDLECEITNKKMKPLPNYVLDQLSMKFGLKTIAVKHLLSLKEGLATVSKTFKKENPGKVSYSELLTSILGLEGSPKISYNQDQVNLIIKSKPIWNEAQENFKKVIKMRKSHSFANINLLNLQTGGTCSLLEIIDVFTNW